MLRNLTPELLLRVPCRIPSARGNLLSFLLPSVTMSYGGGTHFARSPSYGSPLGYYYSSSMPTSSGGNYRSTYGSFYGSSYVKTSITTRVTPSTHSTVRSTSRSRARSPSRGRETYDYTTSSKPVDSSGRPLPKGPGTRDYNGHLIDHKNHLTQLRTSLSRGSSGNRDSRGPIRGDHSTSGITSTSPTTSTGRLSRRTSSVADLTNRFESSSISKKQFGSNSDLSSSTPRKSDDYSTTSRKRTSSYNDTDSLPDINITNRTSRSPDLYITNKASRSPSLDGRDSFTSRRAVSEDSTSPVRDSYLSRRKESSQENSLTNGYRSSSDFNNNDGGIVGLRNIGNTCFMNSVLQCLSNTKALAEYCINDTYKNDINKKTSSMKGQLIEAFSIVIKSLWSSTSHTAITPTEFKNQIAKFAKRFVGYNQQDSQEFLIYLLEGLHEDVNRVQEKKKRIIDDKDEVETISASQKSKQCWNNYLDHDNSRIVELFVGQLRSALTCTVCDYTSNTFDPFWDLSLPIGKSGYSSTTLTDCFDLFTQEEILDRDERPTCARCKSRQRCKKRFSIQKFPKVLVIHLKRFNQGAYTRSKLSKMVDFPLKNLDLSPYAAEKNASPVYDLYAVSNHSGSTSGGHYTAYAKNSNTGEWHYFNDQRVSTISTSRVPSDEAYVLFYQLQSSSSRL